MYILYSYFFWFDLTISVLFYLFKLSNFEKFRYHTFFLWNHTLNYIKQYINRSMSHAHEHPFFVWLNKIWWYLDMLGTNLYKCKTFYLRVKIYLGSLFISIIGPCTNTKKPEQAVCGQSSRVFHTLQSRRRRKLPLPSSLPSVNLDLISVFQRP